MYVNLLSDERYYISANIKNFNSAVTLDNYFLLSYFLSLYIVLLLLRDVITPRVSSILNFLPFIFLLQGTYNTLNMNFFLIVFSFFGLLSFFEGNIPKKSIALFSFFLLLWIYNLQENNLLFDVDKIKGFTGTSYNLYSIIFWAILFFLTLFGMFFILDSSKNSFDFKLFTKNALITGSLLIALGIFSAVNPINNYLSYFFLGLNKKPSQSLDSVGQNAWRGLSPSAEAVGEYFGFILLLVVLLIFFQDYFPTKFEMFLILFNCYGLYKSNNFSSVLTLIGLSVLAFVFKNIRNNKIRLISIFSLIIILVSSYLVIFNTSSYTQASNKLLQEALLVSEVDYLEGNNFGQTTVDLYQYGELLENVQTKEKISSTLYFFTKQFNDSTLKNIPNFTSVLSVVSVPINRTEKWGIFISKYNPNLMQLLFGYGPSQLADYYLGFETKLNTGLVLPHSSLLTYLIFFGIFGTLLLASCVLINLNRVKNYNLYLFLCLFFIVNLLKSDSLLYVSTFLMFIFILNIHKIRPSEFNVEKKL
tara:strand:+ start:2071 stop:3666 length:1596 start_codon:yes stop_codon:yes gene_type:complete